MTDRPIKMTPDERRNRLKLWLDRICRDLTAAITNQHIFWEVQDIIRNNPQLQSKSSAFYEWMESTFVHSTVLAIRRQLDTNKHSISLHRFLIELKTFPELISREYHRSLYIRLEHTREFAEHMANGTFDRDVGNGAFAIDSGTVQQEINSLKMVSEKLHHYADRAVAHSDTRGIERPNARFDELRECLAEMERLALRYLLLLNGAWQDSLLPIFQYDWKEVFRTAWIPDK